MSARVGGPPLAAGQVRRTPEGFAFPLLQIALILGHKAYMRAPEPKGTLSRARTISFIVVDAGDVALWPLA